MVIFTSSLFSGWIYVGKINEKRAFLLPLPYDEEVRLPKTLLRQCQSDSAVVCQ